MPENDAETSAAASVTAAPAETNAAPEPKPHPDADLMASMANRLNIPSSISETILAEAQAQAEPEPQPEPEPDEEEGKPQGEQADQPTNEEPATEGEESEPEAEGGETESEGEEPAEASKAPDWYQKRINRLTRQRRTAEERADKAEEERDKLAAERDALPPPIVLEPTATQPLAHVSDMKGLQTAEAEARALRNFCRTRLNGYMANPGTENESFVDGEEVAKSLEWAEGVLDQIPLKQKQLEETPVYTNQAKALLPSMFERGSREHAAAQEILRADPYLVQNPRRDLEIAVRVIGWKTVLDAIQKAQAGGTNGKSDRILAARETNAKIPLQRQTPPQRSVASRLPVTPKQALEEARKRFTQSGGSQEALREMARAIPRNVASSRSGPSPALV
jgi:hypothetical protein